MEDKKMKLWRYMPLSHYINMVARAKLYIPLTSRLSDSMEGIWFSETENYFMKGQIPHLENKITLRNKSQTLLEEEFRTFYREFGGGFYEALEMEGEGPVKQFLLKNLPYEDIQNYFQKEAENCPEEIKFLEKNLSANKDHVGLIKNRTFVSSWSKGNEQNLALWKLFGHGDDTVAITTTLDKLKRVVERNKAEIDELGYSAETVEVVYVDEIHRPSEANLEKFREVFQKFQWGHVASLAVKPKPYHYENEVRLIVFPLIGAHAVEQDAIELDINVKGGSFREILYNGDDSFIEEIYLPPNLTKSSPQYRAVEQVNEKFDIPSWRINIDPIRLRGPLELD